MRFTCGKCAGEVQVTTHDDGMAAALSKGTFDRLVKDHKKACTGTGTARSKFDRSVHADAPPPARTIGL